jgi:tetratricopeptide (TPR) repeat protein/predicted Ser/Thr protein kinase
MNEESLFAAALEKAVPAERLAFLEEACGGDAALLQRLKLLLAAHDKVHGILDGGAADPDGSAAFDPQATTAPAEPTLAIGVVVAGRYKVLESLGEGGMGTVFVAEQTQPVRRKVALKLIKAGMDSRRVLARFEAERQALALMDHPNIAKILDGGLTESGRPYFVMEYIKGVPLTAYCDAARLTVRQRLELLLPVCQAVQHAHQKGIIHRDLKPSNILVALYDGKPVPKVIDFGLAKAMHQPLTEHTLYTAHEMVMGTPLYMSPEQAELNNLDIDTRTDIYALGVILYELLTGATPLERGRFKKAAWEEILRVIREEEPPKPSTRLSGSSSLPALAAQRHLEPAKLARLLRGDLDWIVMKALDKDRNRRYETANGFAMDVQCYLAEEPVLAGPPTASYRLRKFLRRNRRAVLATGVLLVALLGGVVGTTWGLVRAVRAEAEARGAEARAVAERDEKEEARAAEAEQRRDAERQRQEAVEQKERAVKAEKQTKEQADIALAVNDFLQKDLLGQADIANQPLLVGGVAERNPDVTVRELLDRAARDAGEKFADQPLTEASIRLTIGDAYRALGRYAEAQRHLERSVQLRTAQLGADHFYTLNSKNNLALLYEDQKQYAKAEPLYKEALEVNTAKLGADHPVSLTNKSNLAMLYKAQRQYARAEPPLREVLEVSTAQQGANHPATLTSKSNLAVLYLDQGEYARAEPLLKEVLEASTAKWGADHPHTLTSKNNLAVLYRIQGEYARAEPLLKEVLEVRTAKQGADHPNTLDSKHNLAYLYKDQGQYARAEALYKEVLEGRTAKLGADNLDTLASKNNLAMLYEEQRQYARAEPLLKEVLEARTAKQGADHPNTLGSKHNLAYLYKDQGQYARAEPLFREAVDGTRKKLGLAHPDTQLYIRNLIDCYDRMKAPDKAEPLVRELAEFWREKTGADSVRFAQQLAVLGSNLLQQQKALDAEQVLRDCLTIREKKAPDDWSTFNTKSTLGGALLAQKKFADAEPLLLAGYEGMKQRETKIPANGQVRLTEALERLGQLYDATGRKDKAEEWRKKADAAKAPPKPTAKP